MNCFVINLSTSVERMAFMSEQLARFQLNYQRIEAVTADEAAKSGGDAYWSTWERPLRDTEKACFLSHKLAWHRVMHTNEPALILEDDALLSSRLPTFLSEILHRTDLDHVTLEVCNRRKLVARQGQMQGSDIRLFRLYQDRNGAGAYVLWPTGAAKLLRQSEHKAALADAMICGTYDLASYQAEPACAVQLICCAFYGIEPPIAANSTISEQAKCRKRHVKFRIRRIKAQMRMAFRFLVHIHHAKRRPILLNPQDFLRPARAFCSEVNSPNVRKERQNKELGVLQ